MKTTKRRRNPRPPVHRGRQPRTHCDQCMQRLQKARKLSQRKLLRLLPRMPHIEAAMEVACVMQERGILECVRRAHGTVRAKEVGGNMKQVWPRT